MTKQTEELFGGVYSQRLHRTISRNAQGRTLIDPDVPVDNRYDLIMENVLNWSLAKKPSVNELVTVNNYHAEDFVRMKYSSFPSSWCECTIHLLGGHDEVADKDISLDPAIDNHTSAPPESNVTEWTKEVPVELFTVSKIVARKSNGDVQEM